MPAHPPTAGLLVAIVDSSTLLGRDVRAVLSERAFPASKILLFHSGSRDAILTEDEEEPALSAPLTPDALEMSKVAFFCGCAADTAAFLETRTDDGCLAVDLSGLRAGGAFARPSDPSSLSPLPEGDLLLTYEPVAAVLADVVRAVGRTSRVTAVTAAVDRPASELGKAALDELFHQAISLAQFRPVPKETFEAQSAFNIFLPADTEAWEARVAEDFRALAGGIPISLLSARAGVFHGHLLRVEARTEGPAPSVEAVRAALREAGGFDEVDPGSLSGPVESAGRDETLVLAVASSDHSVRLGLASDHLRRAGAVMAVRLAEQAVAERGLLPDA
jgi:aspartate-semialdehyde dehydrogenase